jgi:hypothetical protein
MREVLDRQAIMNCLIRYARGADRLDKELILSIFWEDAVADHGTAAGGFVGTPAQIADKIFANHDRFQTTQHYMTNQSVELDGDTAHAETYWFAIHRLTNQDTVRLGGGRYLDRFERRNGEWRVKARVILQDWSIAAPPDAWDVVPHYFGRRDREDLSYMRPLETRPLETVRE